MRGHRRADGGRVQGTRPALGRHRHLLAQGLHPPHRALPRRLPLLHVREDSGQRPRGVSHGGRGGRHCAPWRGSRLHRGAVHPGRPARAAIPGGPRSPRRDGFRVDHRLSGPRRAASARRDRPSSPCQPRSDAARGDRPAARGLGIGRNHARIDGTAAVREGRAALRLAGQEPPRRGSRRWSGRGS